MTNLSSGNPPPEGYKVGPAGTLVDLATCERCGGLVDLATGLVIHEDWHARRVKVTE